MVGQPPRFYLGRCAGLYPHFTPGGFDGPGKGAGIFTEGPAGAVQLVAAVVDEVGCGHSGVPAVEAADPLFVFVAAGRAVGNPNDRTSRCCREGRTLVTRGYLFQTEVCQGGNSGVRALTLVSIYEFGTS